jgi:hypothetical protein
MIRNFVLALAFLAGCASTETLTYNTSSDQLLTFSDEINTDFLRQHLEVIAHDSLEGRDTGMRGQKIAAEYIADFYREIGFTPKGDNGTFYQHFDLNATVTDSLVYTTYRVDGDEKIQVNHTVESPDSYGEFYRVFGGSVPIEGNIVYGGFGVNDFQRGVQHLDGKPIENSWVLIFEDIPYVVGGDTLINPAISSNMRLGTIFRNYDASGILLISDDTTEEFEDLASINSKLVSNPADMSLSYLNNGRHTSMLPVGVKHVSPAMAAKILGLEDEQAILDERDSLIANIRDFRATGTSYYLDYRPYNGRSTIETENVLAYLEGADPDLKDEVLVLLAHYDHVGIGQPDETGDMIYNGADDNGSGTVGLMAIADALNRAREQGYKPKRSILFLHVSAEEIGLLGSRYYSDHPIIPIENTVASFNADMIGRSDPESIERGETDYVYLIGGEIISSGLDSLVVAANQKNVNMTLDRRYNDLTDPNQFYRRSDHWNFGRLSVPFVFFFTGVHDDYHQPSDTVDKIEFDKYARVVQLIYSSAIKVANYDGRPEVDNQEFIDITNRMPR